MPESIIMTWSGGKDSALALYELKKDTAYSIKTLFTTVTKDYGRISMHGVREALLEKQAKSLGILLEKIEISANSSHEEYKNKMKNALELYKSKGLESVAFGDIFLEDIRSYREANLSKVGMKAVFPLWKKNTEELANLFIDLGFKTILTCVDTKLLDGKFTGREFDKQFLSELPETIDPCGENGEFHTFVYDGPIFKNRIYYEKGETVLRDDRFMYCDLLPQAASETASGK
ncbi:MAG: diphthine--ammonia ligase [Candidatus Omnitrophica bacterium]|nr:diphthine--ammonia ligase [Candidatus Omnitrophota bacterium]